MKYRNDNKHPIFLPGPNGIQTMIRPGQVVAGFWWSRFCEAKQLSEATTRPPTNSAVIRKPVPVAMRLSRTKTPKQSFPIFSAKALAALSPEAILVEARKLCRIGRRFPKDSPQHWKAGGELQKLMQILLPTKPLKVFRNKHIRQRAFIVGNATSLDKMNLSPLSDELVFGCNMAFKHPILKKCINYYTANDRNLIVTMRDAVEAWWATQSQAIRFFSYPCAIHARSLEQIDVLRSHVGEERTYFVNLRHWPYTRPCFSVDITDDICQNGTTIYLLLHLAYYMGCDPVYLIGCDCGYGHFNFQDKLYETKVKRRNPTPENTWNMVRSRYELAKHAFESDSRSIFNAGIGGNLDVFERVDFDALFKGARRHKKQPPLARFRDKHMGRRIFVMGTGPSLLKQDLSKLKNEITVGVNLIYRTFLPTYLVVGDPRVYAAHHDELMALRDKTTLFLGSACGRLQVGTTAAGKPIFEWPDRLKPPTDAPVIRQCRRRWDKPKGGARFFPNMEYVCNGHTVIIDSAISLAVLLGSRQIYLVGCDCSKLGHCYDPTPPKDGVWQKNRAWVFKSYAAVKRVFSSMGGQIYNATAGGNLDVFQRVDYESLF